MVYTVTFNPALDYIIKIEKGKPQAVMPKKNYLFNSRSWVRGRLLYFYGENYQYSDNYQNCKKQFLCHM